MKFGVREICDVVLKAKAIQKVGNKVFYKDEPVLYFDSLKTSSMEGAATTVYAQGGRGNSRLIAWEGERTVTFTMEDALISPAGFSILSGAGLLNASSDNMIKVHTTERTNLLEYSPAREGKTTKFFRLCNHLPVMPNTGSEESVEIENGVSYFYADHYISDANFSEIIGDPVEFSITEGNTTTYYWHERGDADEVSTARTYHKHTWSYAVNDLSYLPYHILSIYLSEKPYFLTVASNDRLSAGNFMYIYRLYNDECVTEPYYPWLAGKAYVQYMDDPNLNDPTATATVGGRTYSVYNPSIYGKYRVTIRTDARVSEEDFIKNFLKNTGTNEEPVYELADNCVVLVDYYTEKKSGYQIDITPDKFGGNYYLEASTLFRDTNGVDLPAEFTIPNCKIQSNFTFSMASSGDPSTFTFTMDAFPDYTRFDLTKKVLASIQILDVTSDASTRSRTADPWTESSGGEDAIRDRTWSAYEPAN